MNYKDKLSIIMEYNKELDLFHIYNEILSMNCELFNKYNFKLCDIRTISPKHQSYETYCIKSNYEKENVKLEIRINYFKEEKCLLDNIEIILNGENILSEELIDISNIIDNIFKGVDKNDDK